MFPTAPDMLWVGTNDLSQPGRGEQIQISSSSEYPDSANTYDIAVLVLTRAAAAAPRPIATGWARLDVVDGATVQLVGFGAIDRDSTMFVPQLQEVETTITDADCSGGNGCLGAVQPAGELGAGGMGRDTCLGDSGGPLYLKTPYGDFLAGITSRAFADAVFTCQDGGIYVRPDKIVDWIEETVGVPVARGPEPAFAPIEVAQGMGAETEITPNDPVSDDHEFRLTTQPQHGRAAVRDDGLVRYCADPDYTGDDMVVVDVIDQNAVARHIPVIIPVTVTAGTVPTEECDPEAFSETGGGCCAASPHAGGAELALAALVGAVLVRRRSPRRLRRSLRTNDRQVRAPARS
jgi:hypothetical protein